MQRHVPNPTFSGNRARTLAGASFLIVAFAAYCGAAKAQDPAATLPSTGTIAVPTYEAVGLYWQNPGGSNGCEVRFRKAGEASWTQGLPLWYDARDSQCRGSLVSLAPNTYYQVEFNLPGQAATHGLVFKTWANQLPVAKTIAVNAGSGTLDVAEGGGASTGYVVYDGRGAMLDGQNNAQYNVTINASYVIVRGLTLKGAKQDAIRIAPNVTDVVIEDNDISGWGRQRSGNWGVDMDSAVRAVCTQPTLMRVTVQRNKIHDPRYSANSWSDGHPAGPQAIAFAHCGGNHVFRHNDIYSTNGNYFEDIIGGEDNFTKAGFPNSDTDIYGNKLSHSWDDAIEAEGANENVRIWGNYIDRTAIGIATTVTSVGPVYVFRNVWNRSQFKEKIASLDADDRQPFFKSGSDESLGSGRRYVFHNTMLQATQAGVTYGLGGGYGMGGTGSTQLITNTVSKNNTYHLWKPGANAFYQTGSGNDIANELYSGTPGDATIVNGINGTPIYAPGHGWQSEAGGQYQLASSSPGFGKGVRIPNFNDGAATPDVGAHQSGAESMKFGVAASPGSSVAGGASLIPHFYRSILRREPDAAGQAFWESEVGRVAGLGADLNEVWYAMAMAFFASAEYRNFDRDSGGFVTDLYAAFFNRAPDAGGFAFYGDLLASEMPREVVLATFLFSEEFINKTKSMFGTLAVRAEVDMVMDFYRGLLWRLPDSGGFGFWIQQFRSAQCEGANKVYAQVDAISRAFAEGAEYTGSRRSNAEFVGDLYNAFLRRGGDLSGVRFWISELNSGARTRSQVRQAFLASREFSVRVAKVAALGCAL
jgi:hypothetical protein